MVGEVVRVQLMAMQSGIWIGKFSRGTGCLCVRHPSEFRVVPGQYVNLVILREDTTRHLFDFVTIPEFRVIQLRKVNPDAVPK